MKEKFQAAFVYFALAMGILIALLAGTMWLMWLDSMPEIEPWNSAMDPAKYKTYLEALEARYEPGWKSIAALQSLFTAMATAVLTFVFVKGVRDVLLLRCKPETGVAPTPGEGK